jgi:hypothetical protein
MVNEFFTSGELAIAEVHPENCFRRDMAGIGAGSRKMACRFLDCTGGISLWLWG